MAANISELRKAGKMTAKAAGGTTVAAFFKNNQAAMAAVLPAHVNPERMLRLAMTAIRTTPKLMECELNTLMGALMVSAQLGLEPNTPLGHAYLIPFKNNKAGRMDVQFIPGYKGLIDLSRRSGQVVSIAAHAVYSNDEFYFEYGLDEVLRHKPVLGNRGEVIAFYAVAKLKDGGHAFEVMGVDDVNKIRDQSMGYQAAKRYKNDHAWISSYDEMGRKTAIRRLFKYLPVSVELATAAALDGAAAAGMDQGLEDALQGDYTVLDDSAPPIPEDAPEAEPSPAPTSDADDYQAYQQAQAQASAKAKPATKPATKPKPAAAEPETKGPGQNVPAEHVDSWTVICDAYDEGGVEAAKTAYEALKPAAAKALHTVFRQLTGIK